MSPKKKAEKRPKKSKKDKQPQKKQAVRGELATLTARVEALEAAVAELRAAPAPRPAVAPLTAIAGIGPRYAERLRGAGVNSLADLVEADPGTLTGQTGIPSKTIQGWIDAAGVSQDVG